MNEREVIDWIQKRAPNFGNGVRVGIGDDCAVYRPTAGEELVFTTDFLIEGRHFTQPAYSPQDAGYQALARGLSDIAAMGATPRFALVSLAIPEVAFVKPFYAGLFGLARKYQVTIAGGDLSKSDRVHCDIVVAGSLPAGKAVLRSGARPGDYLYVSGPLGTWKKKPVPRLDLAERVRRDASACMDITDGLSMDLDRLLRASRVTCELTTPPPVRRGATLEDAWHHGEDYELLVASPKRLGKPFHEIGIVRKGRPGSPIPPKGWDHFR
ncbi:thiamine-phosphate kinase [Bryobacter aggregatus]|uniref:thiamine-phosphate kinase n=1 Tax=Bryobacter aggregatus TaxID=360054 RepID=UPI00056AF94D|nr:thiamine-phosphate kinase [Bryobacter aggregatus]